MISKYFSNKNSFDLIEDPIKQNTGSGYWYLQDKNNQEYCWNNEVFSDNETGLVYLDCYSKIGTNFVVEIEAMLAIGL